MSQAAPSDQDLSRFAAFAHELADAAGRAALPHFRHNSPVDNKAGAGDFDPVTEADRATEAAIRALIESRYPDHAILGEEWPEKITDSPYQWTLDPIDGTRAFICGIPMWTTLIALSYAEKPILGVIDQPYLRERFVGYGGATHLHGPDGAARPGQARACDRLTGAALATTDLKLFEGGEAGAFEHIRSAARVTRYGMDAYAYGLLAMGHLDLVIEAGLSAYDVRALIPVVESAGGVITDWRGNDPSHGGQIIAAGDARCHEQALVSLIRAAA